MNLYTKNLKFIFFLSLILTLFLPTFFPSLRLHYFIPFLVILIYRKPFISCLWGSLGWGIILDLLSPHARLGIHAINFTLTTSLLYRLRRNFFADSMTTLPIMTFFYSAISTALHVILVNLFDKNISITGDNVAIDFLLMPSLDAAFAFCLYILPSLLFGKPIRKGKDYFLQKGEAN